MKPLKTLFRIIFRLFSIGSSVYVGYHFPEIVLMTTAAMLIFLAVWAFSDDKSL